MRIGKTIKDSSKCLAGLLGEIPYRKFKRREKLLNKIVKVKELKTVIDRVEKLNLGENTVAYKALETELLKAIDKFEDMTQKLYSVEEIEELAIKEINENIVEDLLVSAAKHKETSVEEEKEEILKEAQSSLDQFVNEHKHRGDEIDLAMKLHNLSREHNAIARGGKVLSVMDVGNSLREVTGEMLGGTHSPFMSGACRVILKGSSEGNIGILLDEYISNSALGKTPTQKKVAMMYLCQFIKNNLLHGSNARELGIINIQESFQALNDYYKINYYEVELPMFANKS